MKALLLTVLCVFCVLTGAAAAGTVRVDWDGSGDFETLQEGMSAADPGDTILVAAGTYSGPLNRDIAFGG